MSCVRINSPEFQEAQKEFNLSTQTLKQIAHEWQMERGADSFPPKEHIHAKLQGKAVEFGENSYKLWESQYKEPVIVSPEEYSQALNTALNIFPKDAVISYQNADGNYTISIAKPYNAYLKEAKRDEQGRLLAPNNKPSNLTEQQYVQVRTPQFKEWFGDWENNPAEASKVVDENGEPLVVYHSSTESFEEFKHGVKDNTGAKDAKNMFYFSSNKSVSSWYTDMLHGFNKYTSLNTVELENKLLSKLIEDKKPIYSEFDYDSEMSYGIYPNGVVIKTFISQVGSHTQILEINNTSNSEFFNSLPNEMQYAISNNIVEHFDKELANDILELSEYNYEQSAYYDESYGVALDAKRLNTNIIDKYFIRSFFLNIKDIKEIKDYEGKVKHSIIKHIEENKDKDGFVIINTNDSGTNILSDIYAVRESNQIQSATDNTGEFSRQRDNIYENKSVEDGTDITQVFQDQLVTDLHTLLEGQSGNEVLKRIAHRWEGAIFLNKYNRVSEEGFIVDTKVSEDAFNELVKTLGLDNIFKLVPTRDSIKLEVNRLAIQDKIQESQKIQSLFENSDEAKKVLSILDFLKGRLGISYRVISEAQAERLTGIRNPNRNAFSLNGVAYFIEGKKLTANIAAEEMLHPLVASIRKDNLSVFNELLADARKLFPKLHLEIMTTYQSAIKTKEQIQETIENELVTQALSRAFVQERQNNPEGNKAKQLIKKFGNWLVSLFKRQKALELDKIPVTLDTIAQLINSDIEINYNKAKGLFDNISEQENQSQETTKQQDKMLEKIYTINRQFNRILESKALTGSDLVEVSDVIADMISSKIDEMEAKRDQVKEILLKNNPNDNTDVKKLSRFELINALGVQHFIDLVKTDFKRNMMLAAPENRAKIVEVIKNWDYFINRIKSTIAQLEGIHLEVDPTGNQKAKINNTVTDQYEEDGTNIQDQIEDGQLSWQIENNTIDPITSITQLVKLSLRGLYQLKDNGRRDEEGNILYDHVKTKWGTDAKVGYERAAKCLYKWCSDKASLKEMVNAIKSKSKKNPWVTQLLPMLTDTSGKYTTEQCQFFSTFYKPFMKFTNVGKKGKKLTSRQLNEHPFLTLTLKTIEASYKLGQSPIISNGLAKGVQSLNNHYTNLQELMKDFEANKDQIFTELRAITKGFGFEINVAELQLEQEDIVEILSQLDIINRLFSKNINNAEYDPFAYGKGKDGVRSNLMRLFEKLTDSFEEEAVTSFYEGGKMRQSYLLPSFLTMFTNKFHLEDTAFNRFLASEFNTEFMRNDLLDDLSDEELKTAVKKGWNNVWLQQMVSDPKKRKNFRCKTSITFNGSTYMKGMTEEEYALAMITEFFGENSKDTDSLFLANFRVPIESNKPSAEYITFYARGGAFFKEDLTSNFLKVFNQEISRIKTVLLREKSRTQSLERLKERKDKGDITEQQYEALVYSINQEAITNFDTRGKQFVYLDFLNKEVNNNTELGNLIKKAVNGEKVDTAELSKKASIAIRTAIQERVDIMINKLKQNGVFKQCKTISKFGQSNEAVQKKLEIMLWNDAFASTQIMQLLITDPAFLKNTDDVQKRFAQVHASGNRANLAATDFDGNPVSDGVHRSFTLKDVKGEDVVSNIIENLTIVLNNKIDNAKNPSEEIAWKAFKEKLVGEKGLYRTGINLTDAQAYSCPTSYRKKALMFGLWSREMEDTYNRIKDGNYTYADVVSVFQPFKPFVYGNGIESTGVNAEGAMTKMRVPVQNKNAECLLVMADAILAGEETGKPNLLRALFQVMEDSHYDTVRNEDGTITRTYKQDGIDTVNFESAVKSGAQGRIDTQAYSTGREITVTDTEGNEQQKIINPESAFKSHLQSLIYSTEVVDNKEVTSYNRTTVKYISFENYCMQQSVPEHFLDHSQLEGSQQRALIPSDLADVEYEVGENKTKMTASELREKYDRLHADNIQKGIEEIENLFMLKESTPQQRKEALSELLVDQFLKDGRYSGDMLYLVTLNKETGDFPISLDDPSIRTQVEQAINSIIKSRVNKLKMKGGPLVQMSNFGMSKELKIRFLDKDGNILKDRSAFDSDEAYKEYITNNQKGIAHFEVIAPAYTETIFKEFMDSEGNISVEALELLNPELLKMIGYRIPTEAKYSIAPLKIVGFAPREMGDVIILPAEITLITGSDFDVDKEYCIRKTLEIVHKIGLTAEEKNLSDKEKTIIRANKAASKLAAELNELNKEVKGNSRFTTIKSFAEQFVKDPFNKKLWLSEGFTEAQYRDILKRYVNIMYKVLPATGIDANNNEIFDMSYAVLTSESNVARALKPGGFDDHKQLAYAVAAYRDPSIRKAYPDFNTLLNMDPEALGKLIEKTDKNLIYLDTQLEYYGHNNSASSLLGISAVNSVAHAILVDDNIGIDLTDINIPTIDGFNFGQVTSLWARTAANSYEVSTQGDSRFSALRAKFKPGTIIDGVDVGDKTIEYVYQTVIKKSSKGRAPSTESKLYRPELKTKAEQEDFSYREGYLPLWQEWARQNPELIQELREKSAGKVLTDKFANTRVSQARALADILNPTGTIQSIVMRLDPSIAADGASVAETLGSCVAAAADAAKDPVLNFMNLNPQTFNVYTTLIRMGVPNSTAALFMSSKVLADAVTESNARSLAGEWSTPGAVLKEKISEEELKKLGYSITSPIFEEEITKEELIRGLYENDVNINIKIANALVSLFNVSRRVRLADQITRFNSTSSAVGPTAIDNYIFQCKLDALDSESSLIDMETGNHIGASELLEKHKMLAKFSEAYDLADDILTNGMPQTRAFLESVENIFSMPSNINGLDIDFGLPTIVLNDRSLVNKLREFFTSWSAVKSGLINSKDLDYLSREFPKTITVKKVEHSNNYLVQNLYLNIDNKSGFPIIAMNISKVEKSSRDKLTAAWADLYTKDKEFALNLFKYSFFRGGLGFSPKTFMNVLPIQIKLDMDGYLQLFKDTETLSPEEANLMYKQFVSNNYMDKKLAPIKKASPMKDGRIIISKDDSKAYSFSKLKFFKIKDRDSYKLYECVGGYEEGPAYRIYEEIPLLGAEGNFLEISTDNIEQSKFDVQFEWEGDGSMTLTPDVNDIPIDRQRTIVEAKETLNNILDQNQQQSTRERVAQLEGEAKDIFIQRVSTRLSELLQKKGDKTISQETFNEMLKQLDLC